jgi:nucleoid DNA-binding protein
VSTESDSMTRFFGGLFLTIISGLLLVATTWWLLTILWEYPITLLVLSCIGLVSIFSYVGFVFFRTLRNEQVQEDTKAPDPGEAESPKRGAEARASESQDVVSQADLIQEVADKTNASKSDTQKFFGAFTDVVESELEKGHSVPITGFDEVYVQRRESGQGVNPQTERRIELVFQVSNPRGELIKVPWELIKVPSSPGGEVGEPLSKREREILTLLASGYTNQEIAQELFVSSHTVSYYITKIYAKLRQAGGEESRRGSHQEG